jgi:hypothetical protein
MEDTPQQLTAMAAVYDEMAARPAPKNTTPEASITLQNPPVSRSESISSESTSTRDSGADKFSIAEVLEQVCGYTNLTAYPQCDICWDLGRESIYGKMTRFTFAQLCHRVKRTRCRGCTFLCDALASFKLQSSTNIDGRILYYEGEQFSSSPSQFKLLFDDAHSHLEFFCERTLSSQNFYSSVYTNSISHDGLVARLVERVCYNALEILAIPMPYLWRYLVRPGILMGSVFPRCMPQGPRSLQ